MAKSVGYRHFLTLKPPVPAWEPAASGLGSAGEVVTLWAAPGGRRRPIFTVDGPDRTVEVELAGGLPDGTPLVRPLPGGQVLVLAFDGTAWIYDGHGAQAFEGSLGVEVADLLTTPGGEVWAGYSADAMYRSGGEEYGLVRYDRELKPDNSFQQLLPDSAAEVDALNLDGEDVWAVFNRGRLLVRVRDGELGTWQGPGVAVALLVNGDRAGLLSPRGTLTVGTLLVDTLGSGRFQARQKFRVDEPVKRLGHTSCARGASLFARSGLAYYRLDLPEN